MRDLKGFNAGFIGGVTGLFLLVAVLLMSLCSCARRGDEVIKIGVILPLTGPHSYFGDAQKKGYELALEDVNSAAEMKGKKLKIIFRDDKSDEQQSVEATKSLILEDHVSALMGAYSSACTFSAIEIANFNKTPMVVPAGAADPITQKGLKWIFRINPPSSVYAETTIEHILSLKSIHSIGVLHESSLFGSTNARYLLRFARDKGINVLFCSNYDENSEPFIKMLLSQMKKKGPDAVIFVAYLDDAVTIMKKCREIDFNPRIFYGIGAGFSLPAFISKAGICSDYVCNVTEWSPSLKSSQSDGFVKAFESRYKEKPTFHSKEAFVATRVLGEALLNARSADNEAIRESLMKIDMQTTYSRIKFETYDGYTNQNRFSTGNMIIQQIQGNDFVPIWPDASKTGDAVYPFPSWKKAAPATGKH